MSMGMYNVVVEEVDAREYLRDANGLLDNVIDTHCFQITPLVPHVCGFTPDPNRRPSFERIN